MSKAITVQQVREWVLQKYQEHRENIFETGMIETHRERMIDELDEICDVINIAVNELNADSMTDPHELDVMFDEYKVH